jgi:para-nitrobenzyl esterase
MVFFHGGGLTGGASNSYGGTRLVEQGVVVVTVNYRLGMLGFLAHPALTAESPDGASGNYGLMDQQAALRWVRRNIASFGGDPDNVTIFGQSAGGLSVHAQLASPMAAGLFHKAIVESGAYALALPTLDTAEGPGAAFAELAGCVSQTAECLRALPVATVLAVQGALPYPVVPTVDGKVLTQSIGAAFASGRFNRVPVIEGSNHDEYRLFVGSQELSTGMPLTEAGYFPAISAALGVPAGDAALLGNFIYPLAAYPPPATAPSIALGALGTDAIFACNARFAAGLLAQHVPTYQYEFNDASAPLPVGVAVSFPSGSYHSAELPYLLDFRIPPFAFPGLTADQAQLSDTMVRYWAGFARSGNPNRAGAPAWPRYRASQRLLSLETPTPTAKDGFAVDHNCAFWSSF